MKIPNLLKMQSFPCELVSVMLLVDVSDDLRRLDGLHQGVVLDVGLPLRAVALVTVTLH